MKLPLFAVFLAVQVLFAQSVYAEKAFIDVEYPVIDTEIIQKNELGAGKWLDDKRIIFNSQNYKKKDNGTYVEEQKAILYSLLDGSKKIITEVGYIFCFNPQTRLAGFRLNKIDQVVSINNDGSIAVLKEQPKNVSPYLCRSDATVSYKAIKLLREQDGYIDASGEGQGYYVSQPAVLHRPNQSPMPLNVNGGDIDFITYYSFLNKYQLNRSDMRRVQTDDPSGTYQQKQPFRLMSPDGEMTNIPFPEKLAEKVLNGEFFRSFFPVKAGFVVIRSASDSTAGIYLLQGEKITRIHETNGLHASDEIVSPDGCNIAFLSYRKIWHGQTDNTFKILNVCTQGKNND